MARIAASEARRRKREQALPHGTPEVFVVRRPGASLQFCWEIHRFGGVVIERGTVGYGTPDAARSAGREAPGPIGDRGMTIGKPAPPDRVSVVVRDGSDVVVYRSDHFGRVRVPDADPVPGQGAGVRVSPGGAAAVPRSACDDGRPPRHAADP